MDDANFEHTTANGAVLRLTKELAWIGEWARWAALASSPAPAKITPHLVLLCCDGVGSGALACRRDPPQKNTHSHHPTPPHPQRPLDCRGEPGGGGDGRSARRGAVLLSGPRV